MQDTINHRELQMRLLSGLARLLQSCPMEDDLDDVFYWYLPSLFPGTSGELHLLAASDGDTPPVFAWGASGTTSAPIAPGPGCTAIKRRLPMNPEATSAEPACAACGNALACYPLLAGRKAIGVLRFADSHRPDSGQEGLRFIVAEHIALAVANIRLSRQLAEMAMRDQLTGLYNRHVLAETLPRELARTRRQGQQLGLIMVDIDHFKALNDSKGHDAGDAALASVGALLQSRLRAHDIAYRFGGEEFLLILAGSSFKDTLARAEELRAAIKTMTPTAGGRPVGPITVSIGVACAPLHGDTPELLIHAADQALLRAKTAGRDRVLGAPVPDAPNTATRNS